MFLVQWGYALASIFLLVFLWFCIGRTKPGAFPGKCLTASCHMLLSSGTSFARSTVLNSERFLTFAKTNTTRHIHKLCIWLFNLATLSFGQVHKFQPMVMQNQGKKAKNERCC
uniref:Putative secreted protein n=1 Tax=Amblyomma cajennense TaxID=34607 RepID=A0A023FCH0_AMBCJ